MSKKSDAGRTSGGWQASLKEASPYLGLGMQLAMSMAFFTVGGYLLDGLLDTLPWLTVAGGILGMAAVFIQLIRVSREMTRKQRKSGKTGPK